MTDRADFLPVSREEMRERGWWWYDFLVVGGDAYIDHPSFGTAVIARVLEAEGYRVAVLCQPDWHSAEAFRAMGAPRLGVMIGAGNLDSMVAHYTASKHKSARGLLLPRQEDGPAPGQGRHRLRQPRARGLRAGHANHHRLPGGESQALRALRLLGGQGAPQRPLRREGGSARLRHGRVREHRDSEGAEEKAAPSRSCGISAARPA